MRAFVMCVLLKLGVKSPSNQTLEAAKAIRAKLVSALMIALTLFLVFLGSKKGQALSKREEALLCNHFTKLRPLTIEENSSKSHCIDSEASFQRNVEKP
jgi:hypothetical protein